MGITRCWEKKIRLFFWFVRESLRPHARSSVGGSLPKAEKELFLFPAMSVHLPKIAVRDNPSMENLRKLYPIEETAWGCLIRRVE